MTCRPGRTPVEQPPAGSVAELVDGPWLDELLARADAGGLRLTGEGGSCPS
jgi:hypothetical protein